MELIYPGVGLLFWTTVIFGVLLFILGKYAWKPIMNSLHEREESIEEALKSAEQAQEQMKQLKADNKKLIQEAQQERDEILKEARSKKSEILEEAKNEAQQERLKILEAARKEVRQEKDAAVTDLKNQLAGFSIDIAEKILREKLSADKEQKKLVEKYMKEIKFN